MSNFDYSAPTSQQPSAVSTPRPVTSDGFSKACICPTMSPLRDMVEPSMTSDGETSGAAAGRRTDAERQAIVTEAFEDGTSVSEVA